MKYVNDELVESTYLFCVKRVSDSEAAKDLAQDILYEAIRALSEGREFVSFYSWYWKMARNKYADYIGHKQCPDLPLEAAGGIAANAPAPVERLIAEEELSALNYSLSRLTASYREIMIRFYLREQSVNGIADDLGIPVGTVKRRLFDARMQLKERFDMMNTIGKSAYAPVRADWFWGGMAMRASRLMESSKIIPQVTVICRAEQKSVNDIADEMGIAPVYLEEILDKMTEEKLLISPAKGKYLSNCCVFPKRAYAEATVYANKAFHDGGYPERITEKLLMLKDKITSLSFYGNDFEYGYLMWILYAVAEELFGEEGRERHLEKYGGKYPRDERKYQLTVQFLPPDEDFDGSILHERKAVNWSCLHQNFNTADYGRATFVNRFEAEPFPNDSDGFDDWRRGRDGWVDGNNISLLLDLSERPDKKLTKFEEEKAAELLKNGLLKKDGERLIVQLPIFAETTYEELRETIRVEIKALAREYADTIGGEVEKHLSPYVRRDLFRHFLHWDMQMFFQITGALFWYGWDKHLALPEDYNRSAAGLYLMK
ncbi:MAG: sigma-70 family RNA polymerase sigma factor [Bacteroides sp.]|nr:sigma-70 family RNA polymerase sigma factor [Eubacterium sp.]MCM1418132.1 sigma-70 family RNA polymerase sigma factor [Roseburia sp.]MCM1462243.1 sigma-70 family RNA polymerase sigma factor [Bacteroides sp.]